jgi:hypothetical protein
MGHFTRLAMKKAPPLGIGVDERSPDIRQVPNMRRRDTSLLERLGGRAQSNCDVAWSNRPMHLN